MKNTILKSLAYLSLIVGASIIFLMPSVSIEVRSMINGLLFFPVIYLIKSEWAKGTILGMALLSFLESYQADKMGQAAFLEHAQNNWANTSPLFWLACIILSLGIIIFWAISERKKTEEDDSSNPPDAYL